MLTFEKPVRFIRYNFCLPNLMPNFPDLTLSIKGPLRTFFTGKRQILAKVRGNEACQGL